MMELIDVLYIPNFVFIIALFFISVYIYGRRNFNFFSQHGIKGPKPTAFLGNIKEMSQEGYAYIFSKWHAEYGENYGIFLGSFPNLVISDPDIIGEILVKSFSNFPNRKLAFPLDDYSNKMVSFARDNHWKYLRTVLTPAYSSKRLREMTPLIAHVSENLQKNVAKVADKKKPVDVIPIFTAYGLEVITSTAFGIDLSAQENLDSPIIKKARNFFDGNMFASLQLVSMIFPIVATITNWIGSGSFFKNLVYFIDFCQSLMKKRKLDKTAHNNKDLLQFMLNSQLEGHEQMDKKTEQQLQIELQLENITDYRTKRGLTDSEIVAQCMIFMIAGFETTSYTLSYFFHSVALYPETQEKLRKEIEDILGQEPPNYDNVQKLTYLNMCLNETLRMYPSGFTLTRETKEDCIIKGLKIPKDSGIFVSTMHLHYNPEYWPEPEKYDPERFNKENKAKIKPFTYLPFGDGPRICPGLRLAEHELKITIVNLLRKFRFTACDDTRRKLTFAKANILKPNCEIVLKIEHL